MLMKHKILRNIIRCDLQKELRIIFILLIILCWSAPAKAREVKIATYNVQNLFDLTRDGTEYEEYIPEGPLGWNKRIADIKYRNIARVIKGLSPDIIALEEVESRRALISLRSAVQQKGLDYPYFEIAESKPSAVKCAVLSTFPIISKREIRVKNGARSILMVKVDIDGKSLILFINHWKSKRGPESMRLPYAKALRREIDKLSVGTDFIVLGDFNSNYNEYRTFRYKPLLNDTNGITGINHILCTIKNGRLVTEKSLVAIRSNKYLYNLWLEIRPTRRWSYNLFGRKGTPDSIMVPWALYDDKGISYVDNSFDKFTPPYLFRNHALFQWQRAEKGKGRHLGMGYSDHLPIFAWFSTEPFRLKRR